MRITGRSERGAAIVGRRGTLGSRVAVAAEFVRAATRDRAALEPIAGIIFSFPEREVAMRDSLLMGIGRLLIPIPGWVWRRQVSGGAKRLAASLAFMSDDHHRVRYFVVREIPRLAAPLSPEYISQALGLPLARLVPLLEDLERHLTFLFRNPRGEVAWAYPVTADGTPHRVKFSTGEEICAA